MSGDLVDNIGTWSRISMVERLKLRSGNRFFPHEKGVNAAPSKTKQPGEGS
jgi:hypothetical protein